MHQIRSVLLAGTGSALIFPAPTRAWSSAQVAAPHCKPWPPPIGPRLRMRQEHSPPDRHSARGHTKRHHPRFATFVSWELFLSIRRVERRTFQHRHSFATLLGVWIAHRLLALLLLPNSAKRPDENRSGPSSSIENCVLGSTSPFSTISSSLSTNPECWRSQSQEFFQSAAHCSTRKSTPILLQRRIGARGAVPQEGRATRERLENRRGLPREQVRGRFGRYPALWLRQHSGFWLSDEEMVEKDLVAA